MNLVVGSKHGMIVAGTHHANALLVHPIDLYDVALLGFMEGEHCIESAYRMRNAVPRKPVLAHLAHVGGMADRDNRHIGQQCANKRGDEVEMMAYHGIGSQFVDGGPYGTRKRSIEARHHGRRKISVTRCFIRHFVGHAAYGKRQLSGFEAHGKEGRTVRDDRIVIGADAGDDSLDAAEARARPRKLGEVNAASGAVGLLGGDMKESHGHHGNRSCEPVCDRIDRRRAKSAMVDTVAHSALPRTRTKAGRLTPMAQSSQRERLRALPQIEELLHDPRIEELLARLARPVVVDAVRQAVDAARQAILADAPYAVDADAIASEACVRAARLEKPSLRRVVNASGVIVHTNLGRSVLAESAVKAVTEAAHSYSTLEYDVDAMARGSRHAHYERLICHLTGAEAALAVNNNAAAVMMVLSEFASGHEAIVSRGELVEIGGSFRIPDIMALSHAAMVEVGTTNKTHPADYERALTPETAMLLKVHPSNYRLIGFTESVGVRELRALADEENARRARRGVGNGDVLVFEDQGSGALVRLDCFGEYAEPTVAESLRAGCDLVSFSGDKLLGGPQAGIIVGAKRHIDRLKRNPLARALRLDKMALAALEATLRLYLDEERARSEIPTLAMLSAPVEDLLPRAEALCAAIKGRIPKGFASLCVVPEIARSGGGALPMCNIDTFAVRVEFSRGDALDCERALVRERDVPVIGRIKKEALLFDVRTLVEDAEIIEIADALAAYFARVASQIKEPPASRAFSEDTASPSASS